MKFLVITQDLRVSGTSEGIVSRSFLAKLRKCYPKSTIDVEYITHRDTDDNLHLLNLDSIKKSIVNKKIPFYLKFLNKFYWRLFHISLNERYIQKAYGKYIANIDFNKYDHIFIRSSGINHEVILGCYRLAILQKAIVNFHDPYPLAWYLGNSTKISNLELFRLKKIISIVSQSKRCITSAHYMSHDLQHLYASKKSFYTLPHQFDDSVFDLSDRKEILKKNKKISISYHGALMFGRNADNLLMAYKELLEEHIEIKENTEFILRIKGDGIPGLKEKFANFSNIRILDTLNFSNSANEQIHESDIVIVLENGPSYCNILVGKAAFLANYKKPVLCISPPKSELRNIVVDKKYIADMNNVNDIKLKLENLIKDRMKSDEDVFPFGNYFSDENFKINLEKILKD